MPELPEVETVRRGLVRTIVGKTVASVDIRVSKIFANPREMIEQQLIGKRVTAIERRAKVLILKLSNGWTLAIHLKMTGQIIVTQRANPKAQNDGTGFVGGHPERAYEQPLSHRHTHVIISFTDGTILYFNDLRKFGWMRLLGQRKAQSEERKAEPETHNRQTIESFLESLNHGPEPLEAGFTLDYFRSGLKRRKAIVKSLLLDQSFIAGVGNIYADEALFAAAVKPTRRANSLTKAESEQLFHSIRQVLQLGIEYGGTSFNSYRNVEGTSGKMRDYLKVYGREGQPCSRCGGVIRRKKLGQRSAHFCPHCQL